MGFKLKKVFKSVAKPVVKAATNLVESSGKAIETAVSGTAKLVTGDISGALDKYGRTITNAANVASFGTADLTGRKEGILNINTPKYVDAALGKTPKTSDSGSSASLNNTDSDRIALRQGKGLLGGGSTYLKAKYPLGGSTGKAGK